MSAERVPVAEQLRASATREEIIAAVHGLRADLRALEVRIGRLERRTAAEARRSVR